jgi:hypothetical protein
MSEWKPYFGDRLKKVHPMGFVVIVPKDRAPTVPVSCPVCHLLMRSADDAEYFRSRTCCQQCGMKWADPNRERWASGWRPNQSDIDEEVKYRQSIPISINVDALGG